MLLGFSCALHWTIFSSRQKEKKHITTPRLRAAGLLGIFLESHHAGVPDRENPLGMKMREYSEHTPTGEPTRWCSGSRRPNCSVVFGVVVDCRLEAKCLADVGIGKRPFFRAPRLVF